MNLGVIINLAEKREARLVLQGHCVIETDKQQNTSDTRSLTNQFTKKHIKLQYKPVW